LEEHIASISRAEKYAGQETSLKAGGKQSNLPAGILGYTGNRREVELSSRWLVRRIE
jgi:hypothetical protein